MRKSLDPDNAKTKNVGRLVDPDEASKLDPAGDRLLSIKEVAKFFGVHTKTIWRWASRRENRLVGSKPGGKWMFRRSVVQKFADDNEVGR